MHPDPAATGEPPYGPEGGQPPRQALAGWVKGVGRILGWLGGLVLAGALALVLVVGVALAVAYPQLPEIASLADYRPKLPLRVFSRDGVLLGEFGEERRTFVPIGQIPQVMKDAVLAAEDSRFYRHGGVDYKGIARAALANLRDARSEGASTITMQVARNFYLSTEKTFTRKIYEILLALKIESMLSKDQILELYMNQIFLGHRSNGFAAAAEVYFGKKLQDVSVAQAAMLAGLPKAPSAYNPIANPRRATVRQRYIVGRMFEAGFITELQMEAALKEQLRYRPASNASVHAEFVAETARQLVFAQYGEEAYTRGLRVVLTLDSTDQMMAYRALRRGLMDFELRQVYRGPEAYVVLPDDAALIDARVAEALGDHPDNDDLKAAVVLEASPRKVVAMLQSGDTVTVTGAGLRPVASGLADKAGPKVKIRRGAVVRVMRLVGEKGDWTLTQIPEVEGALVALDTHSGAIRALVGGFDFGHNKFNHVTQAWRQPGSSFKPFIYSAALEQGFSPNTMVNDAPLFFDAAATGSQPWEPKNYDGTFEGPMALQTALAKSKNMVSIRVLQHAGVPFAQAWLDNFGFDTARHPPYLTMALGAGSVTPMQMAAAYAVFANGGYRVAPQLIERITDPMGKVLLEAPPPALDESQRTLNARNAFVMNSMLQEVTRSGTAAKAQAILKRNDLYGKTGTTNDAMDAWFAGFHPRLATVVWIGYDTPKKLGDRETGGGLALPVWIDWMSHALKSLPVDEPVPPEGVVSVGGRWVYEEYASGGGVDSVGLQDKVPEPANVQERSSILDLFKR
ncbi:MAG: penicillin-binding protein 1A [Rubrivivax sp.]|jgi:penicillin-binding protein 1A|nr:penicillin-binding protein 1A [Rubrivivax sp.]